MHSFNVDANSFALPSSLEEQIRYTFPANLGNYNKSLQDFRSARCDTCIDKINFSVYILEPSGSMHGLEGVEGEVRNQEELLFDVISCEVRKETGWTIADFVKLSEESGFVEDGIRGLEFSFFVRMKSQG